MNPNSERLVVAGTKKPTGYNIRDAAQDAEAARTLRDEEIITNEEWETQRDTIRAAAGLPPYPSNPRPKPIKWRAP